jgi:hypothetical protein
MNTYEIARLAERAQMAKDAQRAQFGSIQSAPSLNVMGKMGERTFHVDPTRPRNTLAGMFESAMNMGQFVPDVPAMAKVYHGSPHLFKKFRTDKIGRGQGAQTYGHGLYFADRPETAKSYADTLGHKGYEFSPTVERKYRASYNELENKYKHLGLQADKKMHETYIDPDGYERLKNYDHPEVLPLMERQDEIGAQLTKLDTKMKNEGGREITSSTLYKADIPDESIAKMLDWDKPLRGQGKAVLGLADKYGVAHTADGGTLVQMLKGNHELREIGIPGIKYLDQGSRANKNYRQVIEKTPDGWLASNPGGSQKLFKNKRDAEKWSDQRTRNYVVFDEKLPTIEEINSKVVTRKLR